MAKRTPPRPSRSITLTGLGPRGRPSERSELTPDPPPSLELDIDEALSESFPASDPPSWSPTVARAPRRDRAGTAERRVKEQSGARARADDRVLFLAALAALGGAFARGRGARVSGGALATAILATRMISRFEEVPALLDLAWGAAALALPFAAGYFKRDRLAARVHVACGVLALASRVAMAEP